MRSRVRVRILERHAASQQKTPDGVVDFIPSRHTISHHVHLDKTHVENFDVICVHSAFIHLLRTNKTVYIFRRINQSIKSHL